MVWKKNKKQKAKPAVPPEEDIELAEDEPEAEEEAELKERIAKLEKQKAKLEEEKESAEVPDIEPAPVSETPLAKEEEELTEEQAKNILKNHEMRLQKMEYHLRI